MAVLHECSCSNPFCDRQYSFTSNGTGLSRESYWEHHKVITRDIACGKYGAEIQKKMTSPDSVFLDTSSEYSYCLHCDQILFGGRIVVFLHKEGEPVELKYDDWNDSYHLSGFNSRENYEEVLRITLSCWRCGGTLEHFDSFSNMRCPKCGWPIKNGRIGSCKNGLRVKPKRITPNQSNPKKNNRIIDADTTPTNCSDQTDVIYKELVRQDGTRIVGYYDRKKNEGWTESFDANGMLLEKRTGVLWAKSVIYCAEND